ncbi:MAG: hypothetical protein ACK5O7_04005 [Holosporales bacterium]
MKNQSQFRLGTMLLSLALGAFAITQSHAAKVRITNENRKKITVRIIPEPTTTSEVKIIKELPAENHYEFNLTPEDIGNKRFFAIEGDTHPFIGDTCKNLSIIKDYEVAFKDDVVGTTCVATEVGAKASK